MMTPEQELAKIGLKLPHAPKLSAAYVPAVRAGNFVFLAGQVPSVDGKFPITGRLGEKLSVEDGQHAARIATLNSLAALQGEIGDLSHVKRIVRVMVLVASTNEFAEHSKVANGASELLLAAFGEKGKHARLAVGTNSLPFGVPIEVEILAEVEP